MPSDGLTFTVNATADDADANPGDGVCETAPVNGICTLRAAIAEANAQPAAITINFDIPPTDPGYDGMQWTISLLSALPDLQGNLTMQGPSPHVIAIVRASTDLFRIFHVTSSDAVSISGLSLSAGNAGGENGGGILNDGGGVLTLTNCFVSFCQAFRGGGISNQGTSTLDITGSYLTANIASDRGGGVTNQDTGLVKLTNSGVEFNQGSDGAGIRQSDVGVTMVTNCTVWGNRLTSGAGGIGILNVVEGALYVSNSTVAGNLGIGMVNNGVGLFQVKSSLVARNGGGGSSPDVSGTFVSSGFNLIGATNGSSGFDQPTDLIDVAEPGLDPAGVQDNGGDGAPTLALVAGSPAIDRGSSASLDGDLTTDQRGTGFARIFDDPITPNAIGGDGTDIGAFEVQFAFPTPTPTPTPSPSPTPTPPAGFANISTRLNVELGDNVGIGGFIVTGSGTTTVLIRGIGPSLHLPGTLSDPVLLLLGSDGTIISMNDDWRDSPDEKSIAATGIAPTNDAEAAILKTLEAGAYTAILEGADYSSGIGLVEVYDLAADSSTKLANISTRGLVQSGADVMIGGFILTGGDPVQVLVRAIGPSLAVSGALADPVLTLHDGNGSIIATNDNWKDLQEVEIEATGIPPENDAEAAILATLPNGGYTAVVESKDTSIGIALVEVYRLAP
jgi:CSLREA domain-containing protein